MKNENSNQPLKIFLKYGELESKFEGSYSEVWKFSNEFLNKISQSIALKSGNTSISLKNKTVPDSLIELRNRSYFDQPKNSYDCFKKFKELGKTDVQLKVIMMALKRLVEDGELKRQEDPQKSGQFLYIAPYI